MNDANKKITQINEDDSNKNDNNNNYYYYYYYYEAWASKKRSNVQSAQSDY